jgi:hypothetical protein
MDILYHNRRIARHDVTHCTMVSGQTCGLPIHDWTRPAGTVGLVPDVLRIQQRRAGPPADASAG